MRLRLRRGAPDVDVCGVLGGAEEDVGRPVPERDHFARVRLDRDGARARQPEVGQLQVPALRDQQVLRLQVPVQDAPRVAVG